MSDLSLYKLCNAIGIPPAKWMIANPFKIYEYEVVTEAVRLKPTHTILDLGCGKGHWTIMLARRCYAAIGVDTSQQAIAFARRFLRHSPLRRRVQFLATRLEEAALSPSSLDVAFSFCVLEHIDNLEEVLSALVRLLKPGGEFHCSVDALSSIKDEALLRKHRADHHVVRYFTEESLRQALEGSGLEVMEVRPILTGELARQEFEKRIRYGYKQNLLSRLQLVRAFREHDRTSGQSEGIMLVGRARRPLG